MFKKVFLLFTVASCLASEFKDLNSFIKSSIDHYDFKVEGRYTHEYHPFILDKTINSLYQLKDRLTVEGLDLQGHLVVTGYEGEAIPSYYTDYNKAKINDEMSSKSKAGISIRPHNYFGLMTGFLFRDLNLLSTKWLKNTSVVFEHVCPENVEILNLNEIFQRHAFRDSLDFMNDYQVSIEKKLKKEDWKGIYSELINYWDALYKSEITIMGDQVAATQDILFSIDYGKYLLKSNLPMIKFYCGADITYPIEESMKQGKAATINAQTFVKKLALTLKPIDSKKTVYVFNSFVDGVGKSTMLGNIKNWMQYGSKIEDYKRVDNSSSQWAEVFQFSDSVYIADLPAQMSHFTYKPDGLVYVEFSSEKNKGDTEDIKKLKTFILNNKEQIYNKFNKLFDEILKIYKENGPFEKSLNNQNMPDRAFIKNLILLNKIDSPWVAFEYEGEKYLFNYDIPSEIRILRTIAGASSYGLKNIESEQMLFFEGIRFPVAYQSFLDDLVAKLKKENIEKVVFVDFLSMYPRSSRENIRINYLVQQMALLDSKFETKKSLYKNFISPAELYSDILNKKMRTTMLNGFELEIITRYLLYKFLEKRPSNNLEGLSIFDLTILLDKGLKNFKKNKKFYNFLHDLSNEKFMFEEETLKKVFGLKKEFVNIQQFSFDLAKTFSDIMQLYFTEYFKNDRLNKLWDGLEEEVSAVQFPQYSLGFVKEERNILSLNSGTNLWVHFDFPIDYHQSNFLAPFFQTLRANWYASLANLLFLHEKYSVPPMVLKYGKLYSNSLEFDRIYLGQKVLPEWIGNRQKKITMFNLSTFSNQQWGEFNSKPYLLDWDNGYPTNYGMFAFGLPKIKQKSTMEFFVKFSPIASIITEYQKKNGLQSVLPTSQLYLELKKNSNWYDEYKRLYQQARQNGYYDPSKTFNTVRHTGEVKNIYLGTQKMKTGAALFVRMIATLEMIVKDADSDIVVRKGNKQDFVAALHLIEKITLPRYFGIIFEEPLFDDYTKVEPVIHWSEFDTYLYT